MVKQKSAKTKLVAAREVWIDFVRVFVIKLK